jgi:ABC-type Fe3+/spermidine/putrescine transport system ATPase subunit
MRRLSKGEITKRVANSLELVNLNGFEKRRVTELSGGEQQRVALARALATRPRLLMFDEPLGALDRTLREDLLNELRMILHRTNIPAIYVTHDQEEAFAIADRVLILHNGQIVREGTPAQVWANPGSAFVAGFLGLGNIIRGKVRGKLALRSPRRGSNVEGTKEGGWQVESESGIFNVRCEHEHREGESVHLLARPLPDERDASVLRGIVEDVLFQQDRFKVTLDNGLYVYLQEAPKVGERIEVRVKVECLA